MKGRKLLNLLILFALVFAPLLGGSSQASAMPMDPRDETKVPHYFGPNPNWANSPFTLPNATVQIVDQRDPALDRGATAVANVDPVSGGILSITVTSPGSGYSAVPGETTVVIGGGDGTATATPTVSTSGGVVGFTGIVPGTGYSAFAVSFSPVGETTTAQATASGGVDAVTVIDGGLGYTFPTVDFDLPDDPNGVKAKGHANMDANGTITDVVVDDPGSGYSTAPGVAIHNGTLFDPINGATPAVASATLKLLAISILDPGSGYASVPLVTISDPNFPANTTAGATALVDVGAITAITLDAAAPMGSGYLTVGVRKFIDDLPGMCDPNQTRALADPCPDWALNPSAQAIPLAVGHEVIYNNPTTGQPEKADEYQIGLVQYRWKFSSDLPPALVRGYVEIDPAGNPVLGSQGIALSNEMMDGSFQSTGYNGVTPPQYLGPIIVASKNKPVRIVFRNLLPSGSGGDLFIPSDSTIMGSGMGPMAMADPIDDGTVMDMVRNPMCSESPNDNMNCFSEDRATLHLHGGISPWISDGTAHQWITPASDPNDPMAPAWPQGVTVENVPDMGAAGCNGDRDGCMTFYYTNQQSARLLFYHDHSWGITRLNVYAGEAAGYLITDETEQKLLHVNTGSTDPIPTGALAGLKDFPYGIPLVIQDKTFVPQDTQMYNVDVNGRQPGDPNYDSTNIASYGQDPTWDSANWGGYGNLWYHHVYMPAQNPGDPSGMSAYGRWMYGPWFWPPAAGTMYGPIANPYYDLNCNLDDSSTWQYQTDPFCEPEQIPGTPNISVGMEQFNDTPIVNGVAYPKLTLKAQPYRFRILSAANDRFFNLQWYVADPTQGNGKTEVALKASELAAAQTDPNVFPTPDTSISLPGPDWVQIGTEGGFLPAPVVVDGQQPTTWITDPTRFDVGNVDQHSLLLAPAERADVVVDFSGFAPGTTLILYNDAPAAFPARVSTYDYYTGAPDLRPAGAPKILPGYGPNTRTIMQVTISGDPKANTFSFSALRNAFLHKANGSGVFESGQHPIIVGQAAYNSAYGTNFAASSNCNVAGSTLQVCDGLVRVNDTMNFSFNTLLNPRTSKMTLPLQPKAIHDEMNSTTFDEYGRMQANLGVEAQPPSPGVQNVTLYPFVNPATEIIDATNLPKQDVAYDADGNPVSDIKITPIKSATDGTQIWRITHNGVDTHPIHWHLYDVQLLNRVTWDNIIIPPDATELGWKDTLRVSPLEDTIVALRPIIPELPWELPNAIRNLNPMMPDTSPAMFFNVNPQGIPLLTPITNQLVNFGWEYTYHCHILSHEEMDMMRPVSVAVPPIAPTWGSASIAGTGNNRRISLTWNDNSISETSYLIQRTTDGTTWTNAGTVQSPLNQANTTGARTFTDPTANADTAYLYRVVAQNTVGYIDPNNQWTPPITASSQSGTLGVNAPAAPSNVAAAAQPGPQVSITWRDNANNETGFVIQRSSDNGTTWTQVGTAAARNGTGNAGPVIDATVLPGGTYLYRVGAVNVAGTSFSAPPVSVTISSLLPPGAPTITSVTAVRQGNNERVTVVWTAPTTGGAVVNYRVQWSSNGTTWNNQSALLPLSPTSYTTGNIARQVWYFRVQAINAAGTTSSAAFGPVPAAP